MRTIIRKCVIPTREGEPPSDVVIDDDTVVEIVPEAAASTDIEIDADGRYLLPGFVDVHSHADSLVTDADVQLALLRQGVTTIIAGQDGVSFVPGDGSYAAEYFAAIDGPCPQIRGARVRDYLDSMTGTVPLNVAYLVPAGTVRFEVCGRESTAPSETQMNAMQTLVAEGMADGAVGLSTGLDYVPDIFHTSSELAGLNVPVSRAGGVYVSHMRGGYEDNSQAGISEIETIAKLTQERSGVSLPVHVSHFHAEPDIVFSEMDKLRDHGIDATFDSYPYVRGCTLLGMPLLPPEISMLPAEEAIVAMTAPGRKEGLKAQALRRVAQSASLGPNWADMITLSHVPAAEFSWSHGMTVSDAARTADTEAMDFAFDLLVACRLECTGVMAVPHDRGTEELSRIIRHPGHFGGSDGIFVGAHRHPRAAGTFARYLREYVRELGAWTWADAAEHLSTRPASRFGLGHRGLVESGMIADLILVDPDIVADKATYQAPDQLAVGIDDVLVSGVQVLADGQLTGANPGLGLRRSTERA